MLTLPCASPNSAESFSVGNISFPLDPEDVIKFVHIQRLKVVGGLPFLKPHLHRVVFVPVGFAGRYDDKFAFLPENDLFLV